MGSIQERTAALQASNVPLGFGANATATPSVPSCGGPAKLGEVDASTSVDSNFRPQYTTSTTGGEPAPAQDAPAGSLLAAGWLKKTGKGLKAKVFESCFVSLTDEPALQFHTDEKKQKEKEREEKKK